jgi:integrase
LISVKWTWLLSGGVLSGMDHTAHRDRRRGQHLGGVRRDAFGPSTGPRRYTLPCRSFGTHHRVKLALVFPGERGTPLSGWSKAKSALDTASGVSGWWLHDLRRTLATGLQRLGVRLEVTEAVLNHLSGSRAGVVGIYQRHDWAEEKRAALDAWSAHLLAAVAAAARSASRAKSRVPHGAGLAAAGG